MTVAFVLSGGASLGAVQVGMLEALVDSGIRPDLIVGTSVGAINGGWIAGPGGLDDLARLDRVWRGLERRSVFPFAPIGALKGVLGRRDHIVPPDALRRLIEENLRFDRLEDAAVPFHVVVAEVLRAVDVRLSEGPAAEAILASSSIPGVLPPVRLRGTVYVDGGPVNNTPVSHAVELGADQIWVLPNAFACGLSEPPRAALGMALHAISLAVNRRLARDLRKYRSEVDLRVVPPPCPVDVAPHDFSQSGDLVDRAREVTRSWLRTLRAAEELVPPGQLDRVHLERGHQELFDLGTAALDPETHEHHAG
ncbi:MAG TPA: patatin-like phospholipase family protein [Acidimicrobiales bacterium]|nr:patatin-like phospholipase family protein [Acidimicrobiales bacterium]